MQPRKIDTDNIIKLIAAEEEEEKKANDPQALKAELIKLLDDKNELGFQKRLAPLLRSMAIKHLRDGNTNYAKGFRSNFIALDDLEGIADLYGLNYSDLDLESPDVVLTAFLKKQAKNGVWGREIEAGALADLFDLTVVVTPVTDGRKDSSLMPHVSKDPQRPVMHLYNGNNVHWYVYDELPRLTEGDNNCLYNGIAQFLRQLLIMEIGALNKSNDSLPKSDVPRTEYERIIQQQEELLAKIQNCSVTPMQNLIALIKKSIKPGEEKDYQAAVGIAQSPDDKKTNAAVSSTGSSVSSVPGTNLPLSPVLPGTSSSESPVLPSTGSLVSPLIGNTKPITNNNTNSIIGPSGSSALPSASSSVSSVPSTSSSGSPAVSGASLTSTVSPILSGTNPPGASSPVSPLIGNRKSITNNNTNVYIAAAIGLVVGSVLATLAIFVLSITIMLSTAAIVGIITGSAVAGAGLFAGVVAAKQAYNKGKLNQSETATVKKTPKSPSEMGSTASVIPTIQDAQLAAARQKVKDAKKKCEVVIAEEQEVLKSGDSQRVHHATVELFAAQNQLEALENTNNVASFKA